MKLKNLTLLFISAIMAVSVSACNNTAEQKRENKKVQKEQVVKAQHITKEEFLSKIVNYEENDKDWKYLGDKPCIVDFYATWCGPCKMLSPILDQLAEEYKDQIYIYKVDTDKEKELAAAFAVRSIPTLLFVPMEGNPQIAQGALPKEQLKEAIDQVLLNKK